MLRPALLYAEQLKEKEIKTMYDIRYQYYNGSIGTYINTLADSNDNKHELVSVDENDNVIGLITYYINHCSLSCNGFGLISFDLGNLKFIRDVRQAIYDIFYKYNFNRIEWCCFEDNPHIRGYRNFIKRFGGVECGYYRQSNRLMDGKLHNSCHFEILRDDFIKSTYHDKYALGR